MAKPTCGARRISMMALVLGRLFLNKHVAWSLVMLPFGYILPPKKSDPMFPRNFLSFNVR